MHETGNAAVNRDQPWTVLLVDDDAAFRDSTRRLLWTINEAMPTRVLEASSGKEALAAITQEETVFCVLLDHRMPGGTGVEWISKLIQAREDLAIVMVTGQGDEETAVSAMKSGSMDYLIKGTVTATSLQRAITSAVEGLEKRKAIQTEQDARLTAERLRVMNEIKALTETATHAMRTPLWALQEFSNILNEDSGASLSPTGREYLNHILNSAQRLTTLVNALTDYAAICQHQPSRRQVNLSALVESVGRDLQQANPQRCVHFSIESDLMAEADPDLMCVAINNLVENAWKYTQNQSAARIAFGLQPDDSGDRVYVLRDNGVGFDESLAYKLFCPFQRLHANQEFEGLGMGLAVVRRIIHLHCGRVWAEGTLNQGAKFCFTLSNGEN